MRYFMNLEMIQSKLQDIEQMRSISAENENTMLQWKGRNGTDQERKSTSSLSFRFLLAGLAFAFLIYADYRELPNTEGLLTRLYYAIAEDTNLEEIENVEQVWTTIIEVIQPSSAEEDTESSQDIQ